MTTQKQIIHLITPANKLARLSSPSNAAFLLTQGYRYANPSEIETYYSQHPTLKQPSVTPTPTPTARPSWASILMPPSLTQPTRAAPQLRTPSVQSAQNLLKSYITQDPASSTMSIDVQSAVQNLHPADVRSALMTLQVSDANKVVQQAQTYLSDKKTLLEYKQNGGYNIVAIYEANDQKAIDAAERTFKSEDLQVARRLARKDYAYLRFHVEGDDVQLYMRHKGQKLVLLQGPLSHVLDGIHGIWGALAEAVPPMLASIQKREAVAEAEDIVGER